LLEEEKLVCLTCFQNIDYSFVLLDLAKCLNRFFLFLNETKCIKNILDGFRMVKSLNQNDTDIIYLLMLIDLMFCILEENNDKLNSPADSSKLFEFFYLNKCSIFF